MDRHAERRTESPSYYWTPITIEEPNKYMLIGGEIIHLKQNGFGAKFKSVSKIEKFSAAKRYGSN